MENREKIIETLLNFGNYTREELSEKTDDEIAEIAQSEWSIADDFANSLSKLLP